MNVLIATSEAVPFAKTGGLADVTGALFGEFLRMKINARMIMPLYKSVRDNFELLDTGLTINVPLGAEMRTGRIFSYGGHALFMECREFFDRDDLYGSAGGDYADNDRRFVFFSRGILETAKATGYKADIIHANDWQTALVPIYMKTLYKGDGFFSNTSTLLTIHNLGYQGLFPPSTLPLTGLGPEMFSPEGIEFYGKVNFLKAGLISADVINTVSETYAREIQEPECGYGLDGVLRKRASDLRGITNGIDYGQWNPADDKLIPLNYNSEDFSGKKKCKQRLAKECSFKNSSAPIAGVVGRLASQKGIDILNEALPEIVSLGVNIVILGRGDAAYHEELKKISKMRKGGVSVNLAYDEALAHLIYAGSDMFLMPSRYEPCGLGQMIAQRYGTVPVARKTGGIADTVADYNPLSGSGTGFLFSDYTASAFVEAVKRALCVYADEVRWKAVIKNAMKMDFSLGAMAGKYARLYKALRKKP